ncbi:cytidine deaminase [Cytobacillus sp. FSL K6-0129]|uniref:cytidine deaminase n=1 Tax=Cytobacillus sp. FSL K6-0129 TaxID=2921421 RepID=UPI0030F929EF
MIEEEMYNRAITFIEQRYPKGWGGAAVIHTGDERYLISVAPVTFNASTELCIEVGAICEAHKFNIDVTHCLCVVRDNENSPFKVLSPCGICQERLRYWGPEVRVGVTTKEKLLKFVPLGELQPFHWTNVYPAEEIESFTSNVEKLR